MLLTSRVCRKCKTEKPLDDFPLTTSKARDGSKSWTYPRRECAVCDKSMKAARWQRHKEKYRAANRRWHVENPDRARWISGCARARKLGAKKFLTFEQWLNLCEQNKCHWCQLELHRSFTNIDHVRPLAWGGQHTADNLVMACANCNMRREWERRKTKRFKEDT